MSLKEMGKLLKSHSLKPSSEGNPTKLKEQIFSVLIKLLQGKEKHQDIKRQSGFSSKWLWKLRLPGNKLIAPLRWPLPKRAQSMFHWASRCQEGSVPRQLSERLVSTLRLALWTTQLWKSLFLSQFEVGTYSCNWKTWAICLFQQTCLIQWINYILFNS